MMNPTFGKQKSEASAAPAWALAIKTESTISTSDGFVTLPCPSCSHRCQTYASLVEHAADEHNIKSSDLEGTFLLDMARKEHAHVTSVEVGGAELNAISPSSDPSKFICKLCLR